MKIGKITKRIILVLFLGFLLLVGATIAFHIIEGWHWIDAFYFSVVTITTVGYGDMVPTHDASKLITSVFILLMIPLFLVFLTVVAESFFERYSKYDREQEVKKLKKVVRPPKIKIKKALKKIK